MRSEGRGRGGGEEQGPRYSANVFEALIRLRKDPTKFEVIEKSVARSR